MKSNADTTLYLIPSSLDTEYSGDQLPAHAVEEIGHLRHFVVENLRHARRYLRKLLPELAIDDCTFFEMGKHASPAEMEKSLATLQAGIDVGVISEAGLPGVADPGNNIVSRAHQHHYKVRPLIGPGSIFLALMASGFNGQCFTFHGYLPRENKGRVQRIHELEQALTRTGYTQIFMETPYRNEQLLGDVLKSCANHTGLCIACDLTTADEMITSKSVGEWKKTKVKLHKRPAIFLLGKI